MPHYPAQPDDNGIVSVRHGLGSENVTVGCQNAAGDPVGYRLFIPIDADQIEVATVPGSGVVSVLVEPKDVVAEL
jgi:hypothetical protein